jgi:DNA-binding NarL/FixJ family response regulator
MERLLLVEHNPLFREGLATLLEWRTGLSSVQASSMAKAKGVLEEANQKSACIMVYLDLPDAEGNELLEQLDGITRPKRGEKKRGTLGARPKRPTQ